ncbi:MAG: hypothetical protein ACK4K7_06435 [Allosphingosinicella sp.]|uniref:hypothetical protein n=1 Tax=Allosphingosinicella sp. TaxID=2823234 RepID=UPI003945BEF6
MAAPRRELAKGAALAALGVAVSAAVWQLAAPAAGLAVAVAWLLWLVRRYDNWTGSCLMVTMLVLLVVAMLALLLVLIAVTMGR